MSARNSKRLRCLAAVALLGWAIAVNAGDHERDHDLARRLHKEGRIVALDGIVDTARRLHPGELLDVELEKKGERYIYEVEILAADGRVWEIKFDARDGRILREEQENH